MAAWVPLHFNNVSESRSKRSTPLASGVVGQPAPCAPAPACCGEVSHRRQSIPARPISGNSLLSAPNHDHHAQLRTGGISGANEVTPMRTSSALVSRVRCSQRRREPAEESGGGIAVLGLGAGVSVPACFGPAYRWRPLGTGPAAVHWAPHPCPTSKRCSPGQQHRAPKSRW